VRVCRRARSRRSSVVIKKDQRRHRGVDRRYGHPGIGLAVLEPAQILRCCCLRRATKKVGQCIEMPQIVLPCLLDEAANAHILDHAFAQSLLGLIGNVGGHLSGPFEMKVAGTSNARDPTPGASPQSFQSITSVARNTQSSKLAPARELGRSLAHCRRSPATGFRSAHRCLADIRGSMSARSFQVLPGLRPVRRESARSVRCARAVAALLGQPHPGS